MPGAEPEELEELPADDYIESPEELAAIIARYKPYRAAARRLADAKEDREKYFVRVIDEEDNYYYDIGDLETLAAKWWETLARVAGARVSEIERQTNERLDQKMRERAYVTSQLQIKNGLIEQMMGARNLDFQNASNQWEKEFDRNLKLAELSRAEDQAEQTAEQKQLENARATVTTIYNTILNGGMDINKLSDSQKLLFRKWNFGQAIQLEWCKVCMIKTRKGDIICTGKETLADGNDYVTIITKDKMTGELKTDKILMGRSAEQKN